MSDYKPHFEKIVGNKYVQVWEMTFGKFRVCLGPMKYYNILFDNNWRYDSSEAAVAAAESFDGKTFGGEKEPCGWFRHPESGRRRPDNDPEKEYVKL